MRDDTCCLKTVPLTSTYEMLVLLITVQMYNFWNRNSSFQWRKKTSTNMRFDVHTMIVISYIRIYFIGISRLKVGKFY